MPLSNSSFIITAPVLIEPAMTATAGWTWLSPRPGGTRGVTPVGAKLVHLKRAESSPRNYHILCDGVWSFEQGSGHIFQRVSSDSTKRRPILLLL